VLDTVDYGAGITARIGLLGSVLVLVSHVSKAGESAWVGIIAFVRSVGNWSPLADPHAALATCPRSVALRRAIDAPPKFLQAADDAV